jgi:hypothetical protein
MSFAERSAKVTQKYESGGAVGPEARQPDTLPRCVEDLGVGCGVAEGGNYARLIHTDFVWV